MATSEQTIILITGANGGIGFELAAQLLADQSNSVLLGSRSLEKGENAVKDLKARKLPGTVEVLHLDVSSEESIKSAAKTVQEKYGRIDALVNNAAINSETPTNGTLSQRLTASFLTNATGPAIVVENFAPLLGKSAMTPRIINVTSGAGSITSRLDYSNEHQKMEVVPYRVSKAALNMLTVCHAYSYGPLGWKVFAFCPGFTVSNFSGMNTAAYGAKTTDKGAAPMVGILKGERDEEHGGYLAADAVGGGYKTKEGGWAW